jgi:hypothetical protein
MFKAIKEKIEQRGAEFPVNLAEFSEEVVRYIYQTCESHAIMNDVFMEQDEEHLRIVRITVELLSAAVYRFDKTTKRDYRIHNITRHSLLHVTLSKQGFDEFLLMFPTIYAWAAELLNTVYDMSNVSEYYKCHATQKECVYLNDEFRCYFCEEKHYETTTIANHDHCDKCRLVSCVKIQKIFRGYDLRWKDPRSVWLMNHKS